MEEKEYLGNCFDEELYSTSVVGAEGVLEVEGEEVEGIGGEEGEEGEDDFEEGECSVRFQDEMYPLDFVRDDASGVQLYEQFERYEALAEKKRKTLADNQGEGSAKKPRQEEISGATFEEIMEVMNYGVRRRSRKPKKRGRRKGSKNKLNPEVTRKLGDATLHYAHGRYEEAIGVLNEVVRLAPNLPDPYHTLGLVYNAFGDKKKATGCYMIAAFLSPKDSSLWKSLVSWSIEQGNIGQAWYCLSKAINADPADIILRYHRASLYMEIGNYEKAAESYEQIFQLCPDNLDALKTATMLYKKCGQFEHSVNILLGYLKDHPPETELSMVDMLASLYMENNMHVEALQYIENAKRCGRELPLFLTVKEGICHAYHGDIEKAEVCFSLLQRESEDHINLITAVANSFISLQHYESALKYYLMLEENFSDRVDNGIIHLKMAHCYSALNRRELAIEFFYKALQACDNDVDARISLASLLLSEKREDEAISLLSPPANAGLAVDLSPDKSESWWLDGKIKLKLSKIYLTKGMLEAFVETSSPLVRESLLIESLCQKVKHRKRLSTSVLSERVKVIDDCQTDSVFCNFRRPASKSDLSKANRAKRLLEKKATLKEEKKLAALAAGLDWESDVSDDEAPQQPVREPPLPDLLKDKEQYCLIKDLCSALASLRRYGEALEIIKLTLKLSSKIFLDEKEELHSLGSQIALNAPDPSDASDYVRNMVLQHPQSTAAWNCYYKIFFRLENRHSKHSKFLHYMRVEHKDLVPPMIIIGNQFTMISQHQAAAREYLEAYKLMPESPLINLCTGTALINLALGHRLQNKHHCVAQGLAFLYNNKHLCGDSQESLYNIARACHHVGLFSLAATYYEKVLACREDYPLPELIKDGWHPAIEPKPGYCDLGREAAYNLHLIYKRSGALDLARQVLKDHCIL